MRWPTSLPSKVTFSLIFADPAQGVVGGGVQSHYPFVGATVLRVVAGVGASLSQGAGSAALADELLARLGSHQGPSEALRGVLQTCTDQHRRQLGVIGSSGDVAVYTGNRCIDFALHTSGFLGCRQYALSPEHAQRNGDGFR